MSRDERWSERKEIKRYLKNANAENCGAGPVLYFENGNRYCYDGEAHVAVIGKTGKGKTQCGSLPFGREVIDKGESLILMDPKKEGYNMLRCHIPENYQVFCVDFRNPRTSPSKWNPLSAPYRLFKSANPDDNDIASSMISEFWDGVYPDELSKEQFWSDAARNYAKGLTYALFEKADKAHVNVNSVSIMMEESETKFASGTIVHEIYDMLPSGSLAKRNLATYATAPHETRGSIHSVASSGLEVFSRSAGLMKMLSCDTFNVLELDVNRPFAIFVVLPDETDVYDSLAGLLIAQITQFLILKAQEIPGGKLPIRVNVVLEELGSVGKSIPNLPNLMVAGRSRNIRLMLVLQSNAQLVDVYGKSKAETINSCIGITMAFSTNCWETLTEWSNRCGERQREINGSFFKEHLVTASQLAAMPTRTMLVMIDGGIKFVSPMPLYNEMYDNSGWKAPAETEVDDAIEMSAEPFSFVEFVKDLKKKSMMDNSKLKPVIPIPLGKRNDTNKDTKSIDRLLGIDLDDMIKQIDKQLEELDAQEKKQKEDTPGFDVIITECSDTLALAHILAEEKKHINFGTAIMMARNLPLILNYEYKWQAESFLAEAKAKGCKGTVETAEKE